MPRVLAVVLRVYAGWAVLRPQIFQSFVQKRLKVVVILVKQQQTWHIKHANEQFRAHVVNDYIRERVVHELNIFGVDYTKIKAGFGIVEPHV